MLRTRLRIAAISTALVLALGGSLVTVAPVWLPELPEGAPPIPEDHVQVFGYATLSNPLVRSAVVGRLVTSDAAELEGWRRIGRDLLQDPEGVTEGRVFTVSPDGLRRLDRFEQTGLRYNRRLKPLSDGTEAWVYGLIVPVGGR